MNDKIAVLVADDERAIGKDATGFSQGKGMRFLELRTANSRLTC